MLIIIELNMAKRKSKKKNVNEINGETDLDAKWNGK